MTDRATLYCVSTGPGDPELMTLKALRVIRECPVVALSVDREAKDGAERERCVAYTIARGACPEIEEKEPLYLYMPMTKDREVLTRCHKNAAEQIMDCLKKGRSVAYLTLGDTSIYASCMYPAGLVREAGYPVEMVSGVPSFCAAAARLGEPLVSGAEQLHVLPSSYPLAEGLAYPGVKVLMKAGSRTGKVRELLAGKNLDVRGVERCGMDGERVYGSPEELDESAGYYTVLVVKERQQGEAGKNKN